MGLWRALKLSSSVAGGLPVLEENWCGVTAGGDSMG